MNTLIDTAIIVDLLRRHPPALHWANANPDMQLGITPIVWMEVIIGSKNKTKQMHAERLMQRFIMVYLTDDDTRWAMLQLKKYYLSHNIGINDCLIAAPSQRLQLPLYTRNIKHFTPMLGALAQQPY